MPSSAPHSLEYVPDVSWLPNWTEPYSVGPVHRSSRAVSTGTESADVSISSWTVVVSLWIRLRCEVKGDSVSVQSHWISGSWGGSHVCDIELIKALIAVAGSRRNSDIAESA